MFLRKRLEHVQVEVSTYCQSRCIMCPRSIMDDWINMHMDIELFKKIPFEKFKYAHLQGCLLNPNIIELKMLSWSYNKWYSSTGVCE